MKAFEFFNPTRILFGPNKIAALPAHLPKNARILFCFDEDAVMANHVYEATCAALKPFPVMEFGGIKPNPDYDYLIKALPLIKKHSINWIVSAGGGSVLDGGKFIAAAACYQGDPWALTEKPFLVQKALPQACILTLSASGTEMNQWGVVSRRSLQLKRDFSGEALFPRLSILDPNALLTLPPHQVTNGIIDACSHVLEQYLTLPAETLLQDRQAEALLLTLMENGRTILKNKNDLNARSQFMWAATQALNDHLQTGVPSDFSSHRLSHAMTALYGLEHGQTLALIFPASLFVLREMKHAKLLRYAKMVWQLEGADEDLLVLTAIQKTRDFFMEVGGVVDPNIFGLTPDIIPAILQYIKAEYGYPLGECHPIYEKEVRAILKAMFSAPPVSSGSLSPRSNDIVHCLHSIE